MPLILPKIAVIGGYATLCGDLKILEITLSFCLCESYRLKVFYFSTLRVHIVSKELLFIPRRIYF